MVQAVTLPGKLRGQELNVHLSLPPGYLRLPLMSFRVPYVDPALVEDTVCR